MIRLLPCQKETRDLWFSYKPDEREEAIELCEFCPMRAECLAGATEREEPWGIWGGVRFYRGKPQ